MLLRKLLLASAIVSFTMAGIDFAQAETVQDHYKNVIIKKPYSVQICTEGNGKSDITNLLEGAIIGGAIGNNIPGENGGGAMGAIIGGLLNSENNKGQQCRTETRYDEEYQSVYSHSTVTFYYNGRQYTLRFNK
jgi:uncharacterized protein YcfJ